MTDYDIFLLFILGCVFAFILGCLVCDAIERYIRKRKAQRLELEQLRKEVKHLEAVIDCYESWNLGI